MENTSRSVGRRRSILKGSRSTAVCAAACAATTASLFTSLSLRAATATWSGTTSNAWELNANWGGTAYPGTGATLYSGADVANFSSTGSGIITVGGVISINAIDFGVAGGNAGAFTVGSASDTFDIQGISGGTTNGVIDNAGVTVAETVGAAGGTINLTTTAAYNTNFVNNSAGALTIADNIIGNANANTLLFFGTGTGLTTVSGNITAGTGDVTNIYKQQTNTVTLGGAVTTNNGIFVVRNGVMNINGSLNAGTAALQVSDTSGSKGNAVLNIAGNVSAASLSENLAGNSAVAAAVYQSAGTVALSQAAASTNFQLGAQASNYGYYGLSGGSLTANEFDIGGLFSGTTGVFDVSGGTATSNGYITVGRGTSTSSGLLNVIGGSVNAVRVELDWSATAGAISVLNVAGAVNTTASATLGLNLTDSTVAGTTGIANLLTGGTLSTGTINAGSANPTTYLNFNGGTLKAASTNSGTLFTSTNLTGAYVYSGGGTISNNGTPITISKALLAPAGNGITGLTLSTGGTGYIGAPLVTIKDSGTGQDATGYATINPATGAVTGLTLTSPGFNFTGTPTVTFTGGYGTAGTAGTNGTVATATATTGSITGGGITFTGAGTTTLTGNSTYPGATAVTGGTLLLSGTGAINGSSGININGSGAKFVLTSSVASTPAITVTTGTLDGTGTVGATTVAAGTGGIVTNGNGGTSALTLASLTFAGAGTTTFNLAGGSTLTPVLKVTGALQTSGTANSITVNATPTTAWLTGTNDYDLISDASYTSGSITDFVKGTIGGLSTRQSATLVIDPANNDVALQIAGDSPKWTGADSGNWQVGTTGANHNWKLITAGTTTDYISGDTVLFDDTATGTTSINISAATVTPTSTTFGNNSKTYTISSSGGYGIGGTGGVVVSGGGLVVLTTSNTYSGATTISSGTLQLGDGTSGDDGTIGGTTGVTDNGSLVYNRFSASSAGYPISGTGSVTVTGSATQTLAVSNSYSGGTTVSGGTLALGIATALGSTSGTLTVNTGGQLSVTGFSPAVGNLTGTGGTIVNNGASNATLTIGTGNATGGNYQGNIADTNNAGAGTLAVTKVGTGTITLSGANSYSGNTTDGNGTGAVPVTSTLQFQANAGNTTGGVSSALSPNSILTVTNGAIAQFSSDTNTTFTTKTFNPAGAPAISTLNVGPVSTGSGNSITFNSTNNFAVGGNGVMTFDVTGSAGDQLIIAGGAAAFTSNSNAGLTVVPTSANVTIASAVTGSGANADPLTLDGTATNNIISAAITGTGLTVIKSNTSSWSLSSANSYGGTTTVSGGTLTVDASGTNTGAISGTSAVNVTGTGQLHLLTVVAGTGAGGSTVTLLNSAANVTLATTATINLELNGNVNNINSFTLGTSPEPAGYYGSMAFFNATGLTPADSTTEGDFAGDGGFLTATQAPEPSCIGMLALGGIGLLRRKRRAARAV